MWKIFLRCIKDLLKMAAQLELPILAFGADNIKFSCPIIENVSSVISMSDLLHAKKDAQNALFSAHYDHILELSQSPNSILYKQDVENVDHQDDSAAYRLFCSLLLKQVSDQNFSVNKNKLGLFIYLYVFGELIDAFQNREIKPLDRCYMVMLAATEINKDNWELSNGSYLDYEEGQSNFSFILQPVLNSSALIIFDILDNESFIKINDINCEKVTVIALIKL
ncbi:15408_t:CDS:2 [Cetraspora pellucida]|uniref:15408_t:CDS:1 n=1 Tax=Cetraspora pellucida TaxID=1433469 RepID=A0A9N9C2T3_9GLOM|nr:15408_t:CDS:2 [Cetraspora pellucida]